MKGYGFKRVFLAACLLTAQALAASSALAGPSLCNGPANGVLDGKEECETGPCCTAKCEIADPGVVCRAAADQQCDVAETCGNQAAAVDAACPADGFEADGKSCSDGLFCTIDDTCTQGECAGSANSCSDGNDCTEDSCDESKNRCGHETAEDGTACEDGSACTSGDTCSDGTCKAGESKVCDDANGCTDDTCNAATGECAFANNTAPCNDGQFCTVGDVCTDGTCGGTARDCADDNSCTIDSCNEAADTCKHATAANGTSCEDGDFCTVDEVCTDGVCDGSPRSCDDGNECTDDSCHEDSNSCKHLSLFNDEPCDDGFYCTTHDKCQAGQCQGGKLRACDDGNACTDDECSLETDSCISTNNTAPCDDGNFCTVADACSEGSCSGGAPRDCADDDPCTADTCDEAADECVYGPAADGTVCDDGQFCTVDDTCVEGACTGGAPNDCDDDNECTEESCNESSNSCKYSKVSNGTPCEDGTACTKDDTCRNGQCEPGEETVCADENGCTDDSCNPATGECEFVNNAAPCDDGAFCTSGDVCAGGACTPGTAGQCDDSNVCTTDTCNEDADECSYENAAGPCEDGEFCTVGDSCSEGKCASGSARDCGDGNACTDDSCDEGANECDHDPNDDPCDDGQFCTVADVCSAGSCNGSARDCGDGNLCTDDSCDEAANACANSFNTAPCDDGQFCTTGDACAAGACVPGPATDCDDQNQCTNDSCDETANACVNGVRTGACDDGLFCTANDACTDGACTGTARDCDDENLCTTDSCDDAADACVNANNALACDDGNFCTVGDTCSAGQCAGTPRDCGDSDVCTDDVCNEVGDACENPNNTAGCDDGLFCTVLEFCSGGECGGGLANPCDDGNECTDDSCDETANSCASVANTALCDDEDPCTANDVCSLGTCAGTEIPDCTATTTTVPSSTTTTTLACPVCGDFNGDCELTASDALAVLQAAVGIHECSLSVCDFTGDGQITAIDALAVLRAAVDLPSSPMCPEAEAPAL